MEKQSNEDSSSKTVHCLYIYCAQTVTCTYMYDIHFVYCYPDQAASALPSESVRLQESLKCQLKELNISTDQIRRQKEVCQGPSWKLWSGEARIFFQSSEHQPATICLYHLCMDIQNSIISTFFSVTATKPCHVCCFWYYRML